MRFATLGFCAAAFVLAVAPVSAIGKGFDKDEGGYTVKHGKKAQKYMTMAMTLPMDEMLRKAAEFKPDYILAYGLALELGREPATMTISGVERGEIVMAFDSILSRYVEGNDQALLGRQRDDLIDMADFWVVIARTMSFNPLPPSLDYNSGNGPSSTSTGGAGSVSNSVFYTRDGVSGRKYQISGTPMINPAVVSAGDSCAMSARVAARMNRARQIDESVNPNLTPEQWKTLKSDADGAYKEAMKVGPMACGGKDFFVSAFGVAEQHMGTLAPK